MEHLTTLARSFKENSQIIEGIKTKDGLVPSNEIQFQGDGKALLFRLRRFSNVEVFPHSQLSRVVQLLAEDDSLWNQSALDISAMPSVVARVPVFGVPLNKALTEATKRGLQKSRFILLDDAYNSENGFPADLLLFVGTDSKSLPDTREIQVWEDVRGSSEVFYSHSIMSLDLLSVTHLDGATMHLTMEQKAELFNEAHKLKGESYQKHFRVDGSFPVSKAVELMQAYFPIEELTSEAFKLDL